MDKTIRAESITLKLAILVIVSISLFGWEGYSYEKGNYIEVESYDHGGRGEGDVEYYDS